MENDLCSIGNGDVPWFSHDIRCGQFGSEPPFIPSPTKGVFESRVCQIIRSTLPCSSMCKIIAMEIIAGFIIYIYHLYGFLTIYMEFTIWLFEIAMENGPFIDDFPS